MSAGFEGYRNEVSTIAVEASVRDAADALKERAVGSLVVVRGRQPVGIVTDRDLLERVVATGRNAADTPVEQIMSHPIHCVGPDDPLDRVVETMAAEGVRRVPVVRDGALVGIVSLDDVFVEVSQELGDISEGIRSEVSTAQRRARTHAIAQDAGERMRELGEQALQLGASAKKGFLRELDGVRERIRGSRDKGRDKDKNQGTKH